MSDTAERTPDLRERPHRWEWLWLVSAFVCLAFIVRCGQPVLYWDELSVAQFLVAAHDRGYPTWGELIAQHNESRKFFPRLLFWANTFLGDANPKRIMVVNWALLLATVLMLRQVAIRTLGEGRTGGLAGVVTLVAGCMVFTLSQWQNLLWGIQIVVTIPTCALAFVLWCSGWEKPLWIRAIACGVAAVVATFSYANGMVLWPLAIMALLLAPRASRLERIAVCSAIALMAVAAIVYYRHGYVHPGSHPNVDVVLKEPGRAVDFVMAFFANGIRATTDLEGSLWVGRLGFLAAVFSSIVLVIRAFRQRSWESIQLAWPWMLLVGYTLVSGATTAVGRLAYGVNYALSERYVSFGGAFWIGTVALVGLALQEHLVSRTAEGIDDKHEEPRRSVWRQPLAWVGLGAAAMLYVLSIPLALRESDQFVKTRRTALGAAAWSAVAPNEPQLRETLFPVPVHAIATLKTLRERGLLPFRLEQSDVIEPAALVKHSAKGRPLGVLDSARVEGGIVHLAGWAVMPGHPSRSADAVVITTTDDKGQQKVIAMTATTHYVRDDVGKALSGYSKDCGWYLGMGADGPLKKGMTVRAWTYEARKGTLVPIGTEKTIE